MHGKTKKRIIAFAAAVILLLCPQAVFAAEGFSYTYNREKESVPVPAPYETQTVIRGDGAFGSQVLNEPEDLYITEQGEILVLDSGNSRVVVLDSEGRFLREIHPTKDGAPIEFQTALGICGDRKGNIYIADKGAADIYVLDAEGRYLRSIGAPPKDKVEEGFEYTPSKVAVDSAGIVYVVSANTYAGALQYDSDGTFLGFYGAERVEVTPSLLWDEFWKKILSEKAAAGIKRQVPTSFINFDLDDDNFVYGIRGGKGDGTGQIRKLNPLGVNILLDEDGNQAAFGDLEYHFDVQANLTIYTTFCDLTVDDRGFITGLDNTRNRLFQYDQNSNLLFTFGGKGNEAGTYQTPVAVENLGDRLYVLDKGRGSVTILHPTAFGGNVRSALILYADGRYDDALKPWNSVLKADANYELANTGMGKVYEKRGDYDKAMEYYRRANDKSGYSVSFGLSRDLSMRKNFAWIVIGVVLFLLLLVAIVIWQEKHPKNEYAIHRKKAQYPMFCCFHPFKGYTEMKMEKSGSLTASWIVIGLFFLFSVMAGQLKSFHFGQVAAKDFNVFITLGSTVGLFLLFVLCNWAASTLLDGEGTFKEIWIFTAYALVPWLITLAATTICSHFFTLDEGAFYNIVQSIGLLWTVAALFISIREVHQYTAGKTIWVIILTILGMYLVLIILTIAYSMFAQLLSFLVMIYNELRLKFF